MRTPARSPSSSDLGAPHRRRPPSPSGRPARPPPGPGLARAAAALIFGAALGVAGAHEGDPRVWSIGFPTGDAARPWVVDEMGLLFGEAAGFRWLCDDAISTTAGLRSGAPVSGDAGWVVTTREGVFVSADGGCSFARAEGALTAHFVGPLSADPDRNGVALVGTASLGRDNGVFRTHDGGQTWQPVGDFGPGRVREILRAPGAPLRVFVADGAGLAVSDDGGERFERRSLGPATLAPRPDEIRLLAVDPRNPDHLFVAVERFPDGEVVLTEDAGRTWRSVLRVIDDSAESMYVDPAGPTWLVSTPFSGLWRSDDGGRAWTRIETPGVLGCLVAEPGTDAIWACLRGGVLPWVVARSSDQGQTWEPRLAAYADIVGGLDCPAESPTGQACGQQCDPADRACADGADGGDAALPADDGVAPRPADAGPPVDGAVGAEPGASGARAGGCNAAPFAHGDPAMGSGRAPSPLAWLLGGALLAWCGVLVSAGGVRRRFGRGPRPPSAPGL